MIMPGMDFVQGIQSSQADMQIILMIVALLLIALVLLQSGKAESASIITGGNDDLFANRKERGGELFISRLTLGLGIVFMLICAIYGL